MGSAPGVMSMLTLPQKHVAAEGAGAVDILAQPLRESSSAELSSAESDRSIRARQGGNHTNDTVSLSSLLLTYGH